MPFRRVAVLAGLLGLMLGLLLAFTRASAEGSEDARPLRIGLLPTNAPLSLLRLYDPWRKYLEDKLGRPVELYTAANFRSHYNDVKSGTFDLLVTAPHFGAAAVEAGYLPLVRYKAELRPLIVVPKNSPIHHPEQLRGKKVLTADRLTAMSVVSEHWLESRYGLVAGQDYQMIDASSHGTALRSVAMGNADAAISSRSALQQAPAEIREQLTFFEADIAVPHQSILAHSRLGEARIASIRAALQSFPDSDVGRSFFAAGGFQDYVPLTAADIDSVRIYAIKVDQMIEKAAP